MIHLFENTLDRNGMGSREESNEIEEKLRYILLDASRKLPFQIRDILIIQNGLLVILDLHIGERKIMKKERYSKK